MLESTFTTCRGYVAVVKPQGRLVLGETDNFRATMQAVLRSGYRRIVIDLGGVDKIDCAGLGDLLICYVEAHRVGAYLGLSNLTRHIRDLLVITKLITVFPLINEDVFTVNSSKPIDKRMQSAAKVLSRLLHESRMLGGSSQPYHKN